jgi:hypothetical protein
MAKRELQIEVNHDEGTIEVWQRVHDAVGLGRNMKVTLPKGWILTDGADTPWGDAYMLVGRGRTNPKPWIKTYELPA